MKQRIRVVGIIREGEEVLFLKRAHGRKDTTPVWELPTGKIKFGEQPEEAMLRAIFEYTGTYAAGVTLKDAVTFVAPVGSNRLENLYIVYEVRLGSHEKVVPRERYAAYKYAKMKELANLPLDEASHAVLELNENTEPHMHHSYRETANGATIYVDGCSRGNPGPAGIGYYIVAPDGNVLAKGGEFIGFASSRVSEYYALKLGVEKALELGIKTARFVSDNLMMVNQINGVYQVKNKDLLPIYHKIKSKLGKFDACTFTHVKREQNAKADKEANLALDRHFDQNMLK